MTISSLMQMCATNESTNHNRNRGANNIWFMPSLLFLVSKAEFGIMILVLQNNLVHTLYTQRVSICIGLEAHIIPRESVKWIQPNKLPNLGGRGVIFFKSNVYHIFVFFEIVSCQLFYYYSYVFSISYLHNIIVIQSTMTRKEFSLGGGVQCSVLIKFLNQKLAVNSRCSLCCLHGMNCATDQTNVHLDEAPRKTRTQQAVCFHCHMDK